MEFKQLTFGKIKNKIVFISHVNNQPEIIDLAKAYQEISTSPRTQNQHDAVLLNKVNTLSEEIDKWQQKENALNIVPVIVNKSKDDSLQVIDGKSRLLALYKSQADNFSLNITILDNWPIIKTVELYIDLHQQTRVTKEKVFNDLFWSRKEK